MNHKALFSAELRDCDLISRIEEQPAVTREELLGAQGEWEAEQYELEDDPAIGAIVQFCRFFIKRGAY